MLINKIIETKINIQNVINIYVDDDNIKNILIDKFEGRCFRGCWIKTIDKVLEVGDCMINQEGLPDFGVIAVRFEVTAIVYSVGEIINGCKVINKSEKGIIICSTDIARINVNSHSLLESITKGQMIPLRVAKVSYLLGSPVMSISAIPFTFQEIPVIYKLNGDINENMLANIRKKINEEVAIINDIKTTKAQTWTVFNDLTYAYKKEQKVAKENVIDIMDFKSKPTYISRDNRLDLTEPTAVCYQSNSLFPKGAVIKTDLSATDVMTIILTNYYASLVFVRELIETYSTDELLTKHLNLWHIFKKNKLE